MQGKRVPAPEQNITSVRSKNVGKPVPSSATGNLAHAELSVLVTAETGSWLKYLSIASVARDFHNTVGSGVNPSWFAQLSRFREAPLSEVRYIKVAPVTSSFTTRMSTSRRISFCKERELNLCNNQKMSQSSFIGLGIP